VQQERTHCRAANAIPLKLDSLARSHTAPAYFAAPF
jgi:hypothetical protein